MGLLLTSPFLLAPMAGLSTAGVRDLCMRLGAGASSTGLVDAQGLSLGSPGSLRRADRGGGAGPQILQLFAADIRSLAPAVALAQPLGFQGVELNLGCPADAIVARGCGSALLGRWAELRVLLGALRAGTDLPVGVKCRSGKKPGDEDFLGLYELAAELGLDWFCLHPRTLAGSYEDAPDWSLLDRLPAGGPRVWAGGDLQSPEQARKALERHPALEAVLIGRAAIVEPWIFSGCLGSPAPSLDEQALLLTELLRALAADLDWQEARRILPVLLRHMGLPDGEDAQFRLADRRRVPQWIELLGERLAKGPLPKFRGNPFLR